MSTVNRTEQAAYDQYMSFHPKMRLSNSTKGHNIALLSYRLCERQAIPIDLQNFLVMQQGNIQRTRYTEIDVVRGLAILGMVGFHTAFIAQFLFDIILCSQPFLWEAIPMFGDIFFILAGLSLYIGASRGKYPSLLPGIQRSGFLLLVGLLITCATYLFDFGGKIYFGVLHCMGLSTFISFLVLRLPKNLILVSSTLIITLGMYYQYIPYTCCSPSLCWLYPYFCPILDPRLDHYSLIPSLGFMLLGISLGKQYYPQGTRAFSQTRLADYVFGVRGLSLIGRHSLLIYCLHSPIIYAILYLMNQIKLL